MKTIIEMREKRAALVNEARLLHEKSVTENREFAQEEQTTYDRIMADVDGLKSKIDREERLLNESRDLEKRDGIVGAAGTEQRQEVQADKQAEYRSAFVDFLKGGIDNVSTEQRSLILENRALSAVTGSAGGFTVPQGFYNDILVAMKTFGGMRNVARVMPTASGNTLMVPTANNTAQVGAILAENVAATTQDVAFGQASLGAYKYTSNIVLVPIELIQDSAFNVEQYIRDVIATRIARITNTHFTTGTGTGQPQGIVTAATLGKTGVTGQTVSVIADDLIDLEHSIDPFYRANAKFTLHDASLKAIKKLKDSTGRFLWSAGLTVNAPDSILGYGYEINQDMPVMAANAKSIVFGDLGSYWIRDVMDISLVRFGEKYMDAGQVGFVAFSRHDGKFINAGGNQIVYYANSAT